MSHNFCFSCNQHAGPTNETSLAPTDGEDPMGVTTMERAQKMHNYMHREVLQNPEFESDTLECLLRKE